MVKIGDIDDFVYNFALATLFASTRTGEITGKRFCSSVNHLYAPVARIIFFLLDKYNIAEEEPISRVR